MKQKEMEAMSEKVISVYCFVDDFFKEIAENKEYCNRKCSDSIILTTALVGARYFYGNQASAMLYMQEKQGIVMLDKSAFNRRLHKLAHTLEVIFYYLSDRRSGRFFQELESESGIYNRFFPCGSL